MRLEWWRRRACDGTGGEHDHLSEGIDIVVLLRGADDTRIEFSTGGGVKGAHTIQLASRVTREQPEADGGEEEGAEDEKEV